MEVMSESDRLTIARVAQLRVAPPQDFSGWPRRCGKSEARRRAHGEAAPKSASKPLPAGPRPSKLEPWLDQWIAETAAAVRVWAVGRAPAPPSAPRGRPSTRRGR